MRPVVISAMDTGPNLKGQGRASRTLMTPRSSGVAGIAVGLNITQPGGMSPTHVHENEGATIYVIRGELRFTVAGEEYLCGPDTVIHVPAGTPHGYENVGDTESRFLWVYHPPLPEHK